MRRLPILTNAQRRALLVVEWVLIIGIVSYSVWKEQKPSASITKIDTSHEWYGKPVKPFTYAEKERQVESFPFDPNTADSTTLLRLGLSPWQVRSIYRYRAKQGRYHTPEDFMRVPNLTNEQWGRLKHYIRIAPQFHYVVPPQRHSYSQTAPVVYEPTETKPVGQDTLPRHKKISFGQTIDINTADTSQLKMIPGIASKRAARIVAYRRLLGGFVQIEQAMEATKLPDSVLQYLTVTPVEIRKININKLSVQQLMKHPYLNFYQAKAIFERRRNKGDLHTLDEVAALEGFRKTDIDRLRHYISFD